MKLESLVQLVKPEWREAFMRFIETGEADEDFLRHLDTDPDTQRAVDSAFTAHANALEGLAKVLSAGDVDAARPRPAGTRTAQASDDIVRTFEQVLDLPSADRRAALTGAAKTLKNTFGVTKPGELRSALTHLKQAVESGEKA
jgi:hypothetical protein